MDSTLLKSNAVPRGIDSPEAISKIRRTPSVGASGYWSGQTDNNLNTTSSFRFGMLAQKSAKVPPRLCQRCFFSFYSALHYAVIPRSIAIRIPAGIAEGIMIRYGQRKMMRGYLKSRNNESELSLIKLATWRFIIFCENTFSFSVRCQCCRSLAIHWEPWLVSQCWSELYLSCRDLID
jgi:hypothetical protein